MKKRKPTKVAIKKQNKEIRELKPQTKNSNKADWILAQFSMQ